MAFHLPRRTLVAAAASLCAALLTPGFAQTASYPEKPVKLAVGFAPGTGPDLLARTLGIKLGENLKQSIVVENRSGAGGQIAAGAIAKAVPDGYNVLIADVSAISIAPAAFSKLPYDPIKELTPVAEVARTDFILVVPPNAPVQSVADFVRVAKTQGGKINFATFGAGTPGHFGADMLAEMAGFPVQTIHFRDTGSAVQSIVAGEVQAALVSTALGVAQIKAGKMRGLATTAPRRSPLLPELPTFAEAGYPKADFSAWFTLFVPTGTAPAIVATLNAQAVKAVQSPEIRKRLEEAGFTVSGSSQEEARRLVEAERLRWAQVVKSSGFKAD